MADYGLPEVRDPDTGDLQPVDHTFEFDNDEVTIRILPPTLSEQEEYENLGMETGADELRDILEDHLIKPEPPADGEWSMRELMAYLQGILDYSTGGTDQSALVQEEIERRGGTDTGN